MQTSKLAALYEAVYHKPPSSHSTAALLAIEELLGVTEEDAISRLLIVQLHGADRMDEAMSGFEAALRTRSADEEKFISELKSLAGDVSRLAVDLQDARFAVRRRFSGSSFEVSVDTHRKSMPLVAYLANAFKRRRRGAVDENERIVAARWDLSFVLGLGTILLAIGTAIGRWG